jgi:FKBP-type peptidyl-prolyl cis-trans isomerase
MSKRKTDIKDGEGEEKLEEAEDIKHEKKTKVTGQKVPKTVTDKIIASIRLLKSPSGSSAKAIQKVCCESYALDNANSIKKALKNGVTQGVFTQNKQSFLVTGDPLYEDTSDKVEIEEIALGKGEAVVDEDTVCVISYKGTLASNGYQFDAGKSFEFHVGGGMVIKGMAKGVMGMRIGGRRKVTIPPSLAYGKRGSSPDIPPDSTLCFDITMKDISKSN